MDMPAVGRVFVSQPREGFTGLVADPVQGLGLPFMIVGPILCAMCIVVFVSVSLCTAAPDPEKVKDTCWEHPLQAIKSGRLTGAGDPRMVALYLLMVMIVLYYLFR
jgi:SSS family solute:Na+ symporter